MTKNYTSLFRSFAMLLGAGIGSLFAETVSYPNDCKGHELCSSKVLDCRGAKWHLSAGLLYEQLAFSSMNAGAYYNPTARIIDDPLEGDPVNFSLQEIDELNTCFDYALGLTLGAGYFSCHDDWYVGVSFDWISTDQTTIFDLVEVQRGQFLPNTNLNFLTFFLGPEPVENIAFTKLDYQSSMDFYSLEVHLKKGHLFSNKFSMDHVLGLKALWFNTGQLETCYQEIDAEGTWQIYYTLDRTEKNWGVGPLYGFNALYRVSGDCFLFLDSGLSFLVGEAKLENMSNGNMTILESTDFLFDGTITVDDDLGCILFLPIRAILGVEYKQFCEDDKQCFSAKLGYDVLSVLSYPVLDKGFSSNGLYFDLGWNF